MKSSRWFSALFVLGMALVSLAVFFVVVPGSGASELPYPSAPDQLPDLVPCGGLLRLGRETPVHRSRMGTGGAGTGWSSLSLG